jgi:hypothetical protein
MAYALKGGKKLAVFDIPAFSLIQLVQITGDIFPVLIAGNTSLRHHERERG